MKSRLEGWEPRSSKIISLQPWNHKEVSSVGEWMDKKQSVKYFEGERIALHPGSQSGATTSTAKRRGFFCIYPGFRFGPYGCLVS